MQIDATRIRPGQAWLRGLRVGALAQAVQALPKKHCRELAQRLEADLAVWRGASGEGATDDVILGRLPSPVLRMLAGGRIPSVIHSLEGFLGHVPRALKALHRASGAGLDAASAARIWAIRALHAGVGVDRLVELGRRLFSGTAGPGAEWVAGAASGDASLASALKVLRTEQYQPSQVADAVTVLAARFGEFRGWPEIEFQLRAQFYSWPLVVGISKLAGKRFTFPILMPVAITCDPRVGVGELRVTAAGLDLGQCMLTLRRVVEIAREHAARLSQAGGAADQLAPQGLHIDFTHAAQVASSLRQGDDPVQISLESAEAYLTMHVLRRLLREPMGTDIAAAARIESDGRTLGAVSELDPKFRSADLGRHLDRICISPAQSLPRAKSISAVNYERIELLDDLIRLSLGDRVRRDRYIRCPDLEYEAGQPQEYGEEARAEIEGVLQQIAGDDAVVEVRGSSPRMVMAALATFRAEQGGDTDRLLCIRPNEAETDELLWRTILHAFGVGEARFEALALHTDPMSIAKQIAAYMKRCPQRPHAELARVPDTLVLLDWGGLSASADAWQAPLRPFYAPRIVEHLRGIISSAPRGRYPRIVLVERADWVGETVPADAQMPANADDFRALLAAFPASFTLADLVDACEAADLGELRGQIETNSLLSSFVEAGLVLRNGRRCHVRYPVREAWRKERTVNDPETFVRCLVGVGLSAVPESRQRRTKSTGPIAPATPWAMHDAYMSLQGAVNICDLALRTARRQAEEAPAWASRIGSRTKEMIGAQIAYVEPRTWMHMRRARSRGSMRSRMREFAEDLVAQSESLQIQLPGFRKTGVAQALSRGVSWDTIARRFAGERASDIPDLIESLMGPQIRECWAWHREALDALQGEEDARSLFVLSNAWVFGHRHQAQVRDAELPRLLSEIPDEVSDVLGRAVATGRSISELARALSPHYWVYMGDAIDDAQAALGYYLSGLDMPVSRYPLHKRALGTALRARRDDIVTDVLTRFERELRTNPAIYFERREDSYCWLVPNAVRARCDRRGGAAYRKMVALGWIEPRTNGPTRRRGLGP